MDGGIVLVHAPLARQHGSEHERVTLSGFAQRLAALKRYAAAGDYEAAARHAGPVYFVPSCTLTATEAATLGVRGPHDLFGGVVPHAFVATKVISHPLIEPGAACVEGWNPDFPAQLADAVLDGFTVFTVDDAHGAGERLLADGPLRIKPARATGGRSQSVVRDRGELERILERVDAQEVRSHGLVLEQQLDDVRTFSVGRIEVDDLVASYIGTQRLTRNNAGHEVFGGSDLLVARGPWEALRGLPLAREERDAVERALRYDAAATACYPGFFASRRNYDVLVGRDASGRRRCGVLEQSWRAGGATGPELAALERFRAQPHCASVRASCFEVFGDSPEPPPGAAVYFRGTDPHAGPLTKYTLVHEHVDAR